MCRGASYCFRYLNHIYGNRKKNAAPDPACDAVGIPHHAGRVTARSCRRRMAERKKEEKRTHRPCCCKISVFRGNSMEAERINAIANRLTDLDERAGALRRYL
ncbi:MAG: hypothetical protein KF834_08325 [Burkholderiales bacterium]|nr:hypothetical protein [Burkholderiales bacterium]